MLGLIVMWDAKAFCNSILIGNIIGAIQPLHSHKVVVHFFSKACIMCYINTEHMVFIDCFQNYQIGLGI